LSEDFLSSLSFLFKDSWLTINFLLLSFGFLQQRIRKSIVSSLPLLHVFLFCITVGQLSTSCPSRISLIFCNEQSDYCLSVCSYPPCLPFLDKSQPIIASCPSSLISPLIFWFFSVTDNWAINYWQLCCTPLCSFEKTVSQLLAPNPPLFCNE